jgi:hypothetical protein
MKDLLARMRAFPPGSWDFDDSEDFGDWGREIRDRLDPNKTLRAIVLSLISMASDLAKLTIPVEEDDFVSEDEDFEAPEANPVGETAKSGRTDPSDTSKLTIRVRSRPTTVPVRADELPDVDIVPYEPSVRSYYFHRSC